MLKSSKILSVNDSIMRETQVAEIMKSSKVDTN